jgi:hypothetical protein
VQGLRVCCTPLPALGFDAFPGSGFPAHPKVSWMAFAFPAPRVIPFEEFPSSAAVPHHCGRCPLAVSTHSPRPDPLDPEGSCVWLVAGDRSRRSEPNVISGRSRHC